MRKFSSAISGIRVGILLTLALKTRDYFRFKILRSSRAKSLARNYPGSTTKKCNVRRAKIHDSKTLSLGIKNYQSRIQSCWKHTLRRTNHFKITFYFFLKKRLRRKKIQSLNNFSAKIKTNTKNPAYQSLVIDPNTNTKKSVTGGRSALTHQITTKTSLKIGREQRKSTGKLATERK